MGFLKGLGKSVKGAGSTFGGGFRDITGGVGAIGTGLGGGLSGLGGGVGMGVSSLGAGAGEMFSSPLFLIVLGVAGVGAIILLSR